MTPLDREIYYGLGEWEEPEALSLDEARLPEKVRQLRWKLNQKAKSEPKFRFYSLYDRVYRLDVLESAWKLAGKRGKSAGVDGLRAEDLLDSEGGVSRFLTNLHEELKTRKYHASPVRRVYIPKGDGGKRPLGIPTLKDRVVQAAVMLILEPIFEADFLECSYGFRKGRKAHDALEEIRKHIQAGKGSVYDADLRSYFDRIPHGKLVECLRMRVVDRSVLGLIKGWLKAPVVEEGEDGKPRPPEKRDRGTPQGGVISPLLANVYLHWFDHVFHRKDGPYYWSGARLVRYADDFVILAEHQSAKLKEWVSEKVEDWLGLELNESKSSVVELRQKEGLDFLGFTFRYDRDLRGRLHDYLNVMPSKKSLTRARASIREKTGPSKCYKPSPRIVADLNRYLRGWSNYFDYGYPRKAFRDLNYYTGGRMITHLNRRSQRKYHRPKGMSHYAYLNQLGLLRL
jgi:RNA-directed DNA polymerase